MFELILIIVSVVLGIKIGIKAHTKHLEGKNYVQISGEICSEATGWIVEKFRNIFRKPDSVQNRNESV